MNIAQKKILFIDRDGTLITEPSDMQIDNINKFTLMPDVIPSLLRLKNAGYSFVMVSNQDGLGTKNFPEENFLLPHNLMIKIFESQGIYFESIRICPHMQEDNCDCRKPKVGLVLDYLTKQKIDREHSYVIGDRESDICFAKNLGIFGILFNNNWVTITDGLLKKTREATITRYTNETKISVKINLDCQDTIHITTGIRFFDHMLEQLVKHGGFGASIVISGDLDVDDHHTVEDAAIALGQAIRKALGDKIGIARFGFLLPMDESLAQVAIDLSGRSYCSFTGKLQRERVNDLSTELISHFFQSFAEGLKATIHIDVKGENTHHMVESVFKCVGRSLRQAMQKIDTTLASTKGLL